ncbi:glycosyltransferase [Fibrobacterota bacterium]
MIPYHFHLVWMGSEFHFANRLAVESLLHTNPDAPITVHCQDPPRHNRDWDALSSRVEIRRMEEKQLIEQFSTDRKNKRELLTAYRAVADSYPAGKSNVLRYLILHREGGIYIDFDTITVKDFRPLLSHKGFAGEEAVFRCDDDRVSGKAGLSLIPFGALFGLSYYGSFLNCRFLGDSAFWNRCNRLLMNLWSKKKLNNAVLACEPGNSFFHEALRAVPGTDPGIRFSLGPMLVNGIWDRSTEPALTRLSSNHFYLIPPSQTFRFFHGPPVALPRETYALHWCSSNHKKLVPRLSREWLLKRTGRPAFIQELARPVIKAMD